MTVQHEGDILKINGKDGANRAHEQPGRFEETREAAGRMQQWLKRLLRLTVGLFIYAVGLVLIIQANIGLASWDAFAIGLSLVTNASYGQMSILTGVVILIVVVALKEKIGLGTLLNTLFIGFFADLLLQSGWIKQMQTMASGVAMLLVGQVVVCVASYLYMSTGWGLGPRDSLMVALGKRLDKVPIGAVRTAIEGTVLLIGWQLGAKVGVGTVIAVLSIGIVMEIIFRLLHFDVKAVEHEHGWQTLGHWGQARL